MLSLKEVHNERLGVVVKYTVGMVVLRLHSLRTCTYVNVTV